MRLLRNGITFCVEYFLRRILGIFLDRLLLECTLQRVTILEEPGARALWFVIFEVALEVESVGVNPLSLRQLSVAPLASHLHAGLFEDYGAVSTLLAIFPPA